MEIEEICCLIRETKKKKKCIEFICIFFLLHSCIVCLSNFSFVFFVSLKIFRKNLMKIISHKKWENSSLLFCLFSKTKNKVFFSVSVVSEKNNIWKKTKDGKYFGSSQK